MSTGSSMRPDSVMRGDSSDEESFIGKRRSVAVEDGVSDKKDEQIRELLEKVKQLESDLANTNSKSESF